MGTQFLLKIKDMVSFGLKEQFWFSHPESDQTGQTPSPTFVEQEREITLEMFQGRILLLLVVQPFDQTTQTACGTALSLTDLKGRVQIIRMKI